MITRPIKPSWQTFATLLLSGTNATDAYLQSGFGVTSRPSAQAAASRLLHRPRFAAYYGELRRQSDALAHRAMLNSIRQKVRRLDQIILTSAGAVPRRNRHLIESRKTFKNGGCATRLPCKLAALKKHSELLGHLDLAPDRNSPEGR